jgi:hypothetical protein
MREIEFRNWNLEISSWQAVVGSAKNLWVVCVQRVYAVCVSLVQVPGLSHSPKSRDDHVGINTGFVHYLYSGFTSVLHIGISPFSSVNSDLSAVSTGPIITTTKYINK